MNTEIGVLGGRLQQALLDIERVVARAESLQQKARSSQDTDDYDAIALNLHAFYTGAEAMFEDIARTLDGAMPAGANWHQELLQQMGAEIGGARPPVIQLETRYCLDEYRGFHHLVRNRYTFNLRATHIAELCDDLRACIEAVKRDVEQFFAALQDLDRPTDKEESDA